MSQPAPPSGQKGTVKCSELCYLVVKVSAFNVGGGGIDSRPSQCKDFLKMDACHHLANHSKLLKEGRKMLASL